MGYSGERGNRRANSRKVPRDEYEREIALRKRRKQKRAKRRRRRILLLTVEVLLLLLVLAGVYFVSAFGKIQKSSFDSDDVSVNEFQTGVGESMSGFTTYALFGVDARDNETLDAGTHSDVVMVASVNNGTGEVRLASIYRDTYLCIGEDNTYGKLTSAYFSGGALNSVNTLNKNFDLDITEYMTFNWAAVAMAINDLGGVEVDVPEEMMKDQMLNGFTTLTAEATGINSQLTDHAGTQTLDGIQAVAYCRIRFITGDDYGRTERQREVVGKALAKAKEADIATLNKIVNDVFPNVSTSLGITDVLKLAPKAGSFYLGDQGGFPDQSMRGNATINGGAMVVPVTLEDTAAALHGFLYDNEEYTPSETVREISQVIKRDSGLGN